MIIPSGFDPYDDNARRIAQIENHLFRHVPYTIKAKIDGIGQGNIEVFGILGDPDTGSDDESGPFSAYSVSTTAGKELFAIGKGWIVTNIVTDEYIVPSGVGTELPIVSQKYWIECVISTSLSLTSAAIKSGSAWPSPAISFETIGSDPPVQEKSFVIIGEMKEGVAALGEPGKSFVRRIGKGEPEYFHFRQHLRTNLFMALMTVNGRAAIHPLPFSG